MAEIKSSSSVLLMWTPPLQSCWNGIVTHYTIAVQSFGPNMTTSTLGILLQNKTLNKSHAIIYPDIQQELINQPDPRINRNIENENLLITCLQPFFKYSFSVSMSNVAGEGPLSHSDMVVLPGRGMFVNVELIFKSYYVLNRA